MDTRPPFKGARNLSRSREEKSKSLIWDKSNAFNRLVLISAFSGGVSSVAKTILSAIFYYAGYSTWFNLMDAGAVIFRTTTFLLDFWHLAFAMATHILWGSVLGVGLGLTYLLVGRNHYLIIGSFYGFFIWIVVRNFFATISLQEGLPELGVASVTISFPSHILWGALAGFLIVRLFPIKKVN